MTLEKRYADSVAKLEATAARDDKKSPDELLAEMKTSLAKDSIFYLSARFRLLLLPSLKGRPDFSSTILECISEIVKSSCAEKTELLSFINVLAELDIEIYLAAIQLLLKDPDPKVRTEALYLIGSQAKPCSEVIDRLIQPLSEALENEQDGRIRAQILRILHYSELSSEADLYAMSIDRDPHVRAEYYILKFGREGERKIDEIIDIGLPALKDKDTIVRAYVGREMIKRFRHYNSNNAVCEGMKKKFNDEGCLSFSPAPGKRGHLHGWTLEIPSLRKDLIKVIEDSEIGDFALMPYISTLIKREYEGIRHPGDDEGHDDIGDTVLNHIRKLSQEANPNLKYLVLLFNYLPKDYNLLQFFSETSFRDLIFILETHQGWGSLVILDFLEKLKNMALEIYDFDKETSDASDAPPPTRLEKYLRVAEKTGKKRIRLFLDPYGGRGERNPGSYKMDLVKLGDEIFVIRTMDIVAFRIWHRVFSDRSGWEKDGFEYVPVEEPIRVWTTSLPGLVRVASRVLTGQDSRTYEYEEENGLVSDEIERIKGHKVGGVPVERLQNDIHPGNWIISSDGKDSSVRAYLIDWSLAGEGEGHK